MHIHPIHMDNLEIDEVTINILVATDTLPTTGKIVLSINHSHRFNQKNTSTRVKSRTWIQVNRFHHKKHNQISQFAAPWVQNEGPKDIYLI